MDQVRVGVVGVGHLGGFHARSYDTISEARLIGLYDAEIEKARQKAAELNTRAFEDLDELLKEVSAVSVAVPTKAHHRIASRCLQNGVHVLVEKPIAVDLQQADELIRMADRNGVVLQVGHIERFNPAYLELASIGLEPMFIESHRLAPFTPRGADVAVILDLMIHDIDLILDLVDLPVQDVQAAGVAVLSQNEDIANARVTFSNGAVANMTASRISTKAMRKMRLFGRNIYVSADYLERELDIYRLEQQEPLRKPNHQPLGPRAQEALLSRGQSIVHQRPRLERTDALQLEQRSFLRSVTGDQQPAASGRDGRKALELALKIMDRLTEHARWVQESRSL
jgi:predicted dehydrogenase